MQEPSGAGGRARPSRLRRALAAGKTPARAPPRGALCPARARAPPRAAPDLPSLPAALAEHCNFHLVTHVVNLLAADQLIPIQIASMGQAVAGQLTSVWQAAVAQGSYRHGHRQGRQVIDCAACSCAGVEPRGDRGRSPQPLSPSALSSTENLGFQSLIQLRMHLQQPRET